MTLARILWKDVFNYSENPFGALYSWKFLCKSPATLFLKTYQHCSARSSCTCRFSRISEIYFSLHSSTRPSLLNTDSSIRGDFVELSHKSRCQLHDFPRQNRQHWLNICAPPPFIRFLRIPFARYCIPKHYRLFYFLVTVDQPWMGTFAENLLTRSEGLLNVRLFSGSGSLGLSGKGGVEYALSLD